MSINPIHLDSWTVPIIEKNENSVSIYVKNFFNYSGKYYVFDNSKVDNLVQKTDNSSVTLKILLVATILFPLIACTYIALSKWSSTTKKIHNQSFDIHFNKCLVNDIYNSTQKEEKVTKIEPENNKHEAVEDKFTSLIKLIEDQKTTISDDDKKRIFSIHHSNYQKSLHKKFAEETAQAVKKFIDESHSICSSTEEFCYLIEKIGELKKRINSKISEEINVSILSTINFVEIANATLNFAIEKLQKFTDGDKIHVAINKICKSMNDHYKLSADQKMMYARLWTIAYVDHISRHGINTSDFKTFMKSIYEIINDKDSQPIKLSPHYKEFKSSFEVIECYDCTTLFSPLDLTEMKDLYDPIAKILELPVYKTEKDTANDELFAKLLNEQETEKLNNFDEALAKELQRKENERPFKPY